MFDVTILKILTPTELNWSSAQGSAFCDAGQNYSQGPLHTWKNLQRGEQGVRIGNVILVIVTFICPVNPANDAKHIDQLVSAQFHLKTSF